MSLLEQHPSASQAWLGDLPVTSRYTSGVAGERFFRALKDDGKILGSRCEACDLTYVPGRQFCERCLDELTDWLDVGTKGEVHTFTLLYENVDGSSKEEPEVIAFIRMGDGGIVHRLGEVDLEEIDIGMLVEAVFRSKAEREGNILDIQYFRPSAP
jgi:uncharacterized OB-fold protein